MNIIIVLTLTAFILSLMITLINMLINKDKLEIDDIISKLPGLNCGACGYGSCLGMAKEILKNKEVYKNCRLLKGQKKEELEIYIANIENKNSN